jgi:hypothetical protein
MAMLNRLDRYYRQRRGVTGGHSGGSLLPGGALLNVTFSTDDAAPLHATDYPTDAGQLLATQDADDDLKADSGWLNRNLHTTWSEAYVNAGDGLGGALAMSPREGLAMYIKGASASAARLFGGFTNVASSFGGMSGNVGGFGIRGIDVNGGDIYPDLAPDDIWPDDTDLLILVTRYGGQLWAYIDSAWQLLWVQENTATFATMYAILGTLSAGNICQAWKIYRLPGEAGDSTPGNGHAFCGHRDLALSYADTTPSSPDAFTHTADFTMQITVAAFPSAGNAIIKFREQDATNYWRLLVQAGGAVVLQEVVAGGATTHASVSGLSNGVIISMTALDETVKVFDDGNLSFTYASASNFKTETSGEISSLGTGGDLDDLTVRTLDSAGGNGTQGIATDIIPGPLQASDTFTHEADCVLRVHLAALPTAGNVQFSFREQDANNYWRINVYSTGRYRLTEVVGGTPTTRAETGTGALSGDEWLTIIVNDEEITGYYDNTQGWTYGSAANFKTETSGEIHWFGTAGMLANLIAMPLIAPSTPVNLAAVLDAVAAA